MREDDKSSKNLSSDELARLKKVKEGFSGGLGEGKQEAYTSQERASFQSLGGNTLAALAEIIPELWNKDNNPYNLLNYLARVRERESYVHDLIRGGEEIDYLIVDANINSLLFTKYRKGRTYDEVTGRKNIPPIVLQVDLLFKDFIGKHSVSQANFPKIHETVIAVAKKLGFVTKKTDPSMIQPPPHGTLESIVHGFNYPEGGKKPPESKSTIYSPKHLRGEPYMMEFIFHDSHAVGFKIRYTPKILPTS